MRRGEMDLTISTNPSSIVVTDEKTNNVDPQKRSVKSYATKVFQESTIGMVSSIVTTHSPYRRVFKTVLFLLCISGFLYQCVSFLKYVFEYPTTVDVEIEVPETYDIPAYTLCTNNPIKRSMFCSMYSERCYKPTETFCKKFSSYCGSNGTQTHIPLKKYYELEESMSHEEILNYGDDLSEFFIEKRSRIRNGEKPSGPYLRIKNENTMRGAMICYSLHSVVENNHHPTQKKYDSYDKLPVDVLTFYIDESEMFIPGNGPGVLFSIHSPYEAVNPFQDGIFMKPGRNYKIYVEMKQEILLKDPFETNCMDYNELWERNNYTGSRIQEMCQHKCLLDFSLELLNCVVPFILYPTDERLCELEEMSVDVPSEKWDNVTRCWKNCRDDCKVTIYRPEVLERYEVDYDNSEVLEEFKRYITVEVYLEDGEIMKLKHVPKYMTVEVFSNIGGFIGCWLGIALMDIIDAFSSVFTVCKYAFKKRERNL